MQKLERSFSINGKARSTLNNYGRCLAHMALHFKESPVLLYSFFGSCKMQGINPREWLANTLKRIPDHNIQKLDQLLPGYQKDGV